MSRFSKIIDQLEELNQQDADNYQADIKNSAKTFAIAAHLYERLNQLAEPPSEPKALLKPKKITKKFLIETFGGYDKAYKAYQQAYGIKCRKSWKNFLALIQDLEIPEVNNSTTEERLQRLEEKVDLLLEILLNNVATVSKP